MVALQGLTRQGVKDNQDFKSREAPATAMCHTQGDRTALEGADHLDASANRHQPP